MPYTSPSTPEVDALLRASSRHPRDHVILSLALGTGLRLAEVVGLDVGDVFLPRRHAPAVGAAPAGHRQGRPGR